MSKGISFNQIKHHLLGNPEEDLVLLANWLKIEFPSSALRHIRTQ